MIGRIGLILWINPACGTAWWKQLRLDSSTARRPAQRNSERETAGLRSLRVRTAGRTGPHAVRVRNASRARSPRGPTIAVRTSLNVPDCRRTTGPFASGACGGRRLPSRPLQPPRRRNGGGQPLREVRGLHHRRELARSRLILRLEDRDSVLEGGERRARELRSHARRSGRPRVALGDAPLRLLDDPHRDGARGRPSPSCSRGRSGGRVYSGPSSSCLSWSPRWWWGSSGGTSSTRGSAGSTTTSGSGSSSSRKFFTLFFGGVCAYALARRPSGPSSFGPFPLGAVRRRRASAVRPMDRRALARPVTTRTPIASLVSATRAAVTAANVRSAPGNPSGLRTRAGRRRSLRPRWRRVPARRGEYAGPRP